MRIAMIVGHFPLLSETFVINQIVGLLRRGHEVDIYTRRLGEQSKLHPEVVAYDLLKSTYLLPGKPATLLGYLKCTAKTLLRQSLVDPLRLPRLIRVFWGSEGSLEDRLRVAQATVGKAPYDIVHCQFGTLGELGMTFRAVNRGKLIVSFRGHDISQYVQERGESVYNNLFSTVDLCLTNCVFFQQRLLAMGCPAGQLKVLYSGLNPKQFPFQARHFPEDGRVRIALTGRLVEKKGIPDAIWAVAQVAKTYPNLEFNIIGEGEQRPLLEALIQQLGMQEQIHLLGQKNQMEIVEILSGSHLFLAPSVTAADGNQDAPVNVLKEAMAMGLPVISTWHGGIPELVQEGISGFLVPERDLGALAERLHDLIQHPQRWPEMGRAGRSFVEQVFDLETLNDELVRHYQKLLWEDALDVLTDPTPQPSA
ncbi:glycosyltransferase [Synechococcus sp. Nb3U1]|uniref:glycosyltransferase n=1 Tax=Synechococcus sp. Nb3U1 TaxID=1914529 RepID=UPI001F2094D6|nr:glycosyltransferase [Synechococcus sp. Nb3U1]MCF2971281.1 glycosyltransferase [Synechococcus sp. Nb3U1]